MNIPSPVEFLLGIKLYDPIEYIGEDVWKVLDLIYFGGTYDSFCTKCVNTSTFQVQAPTRPHEHIRNPSHEALIKAHSGKNDYPRLKSSVFEVKSLCSREKSHQQNFLFFINYELFREGEKPKLKSTVQKIGQQPSYSDLHIAQIKKYKHVLSKEQLSELTKAIGLASHDVGVGSYVYLRRIFESLVEEAHQKALSVSGWDEAIYEKARMAERISILSTNLPQFLVENPGMYGLLSKGVHELSEKECLEHFETLRIAIEMILDERLAERERVQKALAAKAALQKSISAVSSPQSPN